MTSLTTSMKQGALEIHIFATFTSLHVSLLVEMVFLLSFTPGMSRYDSYE